MTNQELQDKYRPLAQEIHSKQKGIETLHAAVKHKLQKNTDLLKSVIRRINKNGILRTDIVVKNSYNSTYCYGINASGLVQYHKGTTYTGRSFTTETKDLLLFLSSPDFLDRLMAKLPDKRQRIVGDLKLCTEECKNLLSINGMTEKNTIAIGFGSGIPIPTIETFDKNLSLYSFTSAGILFGDGIKIKVSAKDNAALAGDALLFDYTYGDDRKYFLTLGTQSFNDLFILEQLKPTFNASYNMAMGMLREHDATLDAIYNRLTEKLSVYFVLDSFKSASGKSHVL